MLVSTGALNVLRWAHNLFGGSLPLCTGRAVAEAGARARVLHRRRRLEAAPVPAERRVVDGRTVVPAEVAEACLAHGPQSQIVQAYQRSDLLTRRETVSLRRGRNTDIAP